MRPCEKLDKLFGELATDFIGEVVIPKLKRYDWVVYWGNGTVCFEDSQGVDRSDEANSVFEALVQEQFNGYLFDLGLWHLLESYNSTKGTYGPFDVPCLDYRVNQ